MKRPLGIHALFLGVHMAGDIDLNGDGEISYEEFKQMLEEDHSIYERSPRHSTLSWSPTRKLSPERASPADEGVVVGH